MYRNRLEEIRKEKGISYKRWAEESGVSIDTISRIIHPENPEKDSPRVSTLEPLCKPLGVELWEIFYMGDRSFVSLVTELNSLKVERDEFIAKAAAQEERIGELEKKISEQRDKIDNLKDEIIETHKYYNQRK
ncbi:MAG: helix-turn-helix domain-containing protein [Clostridia bacterium]|nr:helix-turn-helix domain-containing protein [Clostridia bacterium]